MDSRGAEHLALMNVAGRHVFGILAPIVTVMLAVVYFVSVNDRIQQSATSLGYNNYLAGVDGATKTASIDLEWYIIGAVLIVCMFGGGYMFSRRREQCIQVLRYVMLLDFWLMFVGGGAILVGFLAVDLGIPLDLFTLLIMVVNFGTMATFSMYVVQFPPSLHRVFLIALNIIMALLLAISLPWLMILVLVGLIAGLDMVSSYLYMHINGGELTPFILPTRFQLLYETPKLLYHVGGLRMRNLDLMLYGLMVSLMPHSLGAISVGFMVILCSIALVCFLNPYYGFDRLRPLPVALFFTLVAWYMTEDALLPCMSSLAPMLTRNPTTLTV
jgi:hypothetical protein